jgi:hypothetical protein
MNKLPRRIAFASLAAILGLSTTAHAFTDSNAELKDAGERSARVVIVGKAAPAARTAWVPPSAKRLDGFKPVLPPERGAAETLAKADVATPAKR